MKKVLTISLMTGLLLNACGEFEQPSNPTLQSPSSRFVPKAYRAPNIAFDTDGFTLGPGASELLGPAEVNRAVNGLVADFGVHPINLVEGSTIRIVGWSDAWASYYVYGPADLSGMRPLVANQEMSDPVKAGLERRYFDFTADVSGDYLLVVGPIATADVEYVMLPQCIGGPCSN